MSASIFPNFAMAEISLGFTFKTLPFAEIDPRAMSQFQGQRGRREQKA
jgi:hypothetical protein